MKLSARRRTALAAAAGVLLAGLGVGAGLSAAGSGTPAQPARAATAASAAAASSGDSPSGFWYGSDSTSIPVPGPAPFREPAIGGAYGGYVGMIGGFASWQGCGQQVWSAADSRSARENYVTSRAGIGVGGFWFMGGPGVDPGYDGTAAEAYRWGAAQAAQAIASLPRLPVPVNFPVLFMDIELPGRAPAFTQAPDNGWNTVYTSACSGVVKRTRIPAAVDRADLNGFAGYLTAHSSYQPGVYSAPSIWSSIFGRGASAAIPHLYEWTYNGLTTSLARRPDGWCLPGTSTCAQFFGGQTSASRYALMWQWSGGGGARNGVGDFDQIDAARAPA